LIDLVDETEVFLNVYHGLAVCKDAVIYRDSLCFNRAIIENTSQSLEDFLTKYPNSKFFDQAKIKLFEVAYDEAVTIHTEEGYLKFNKKYPSSPFFEKSLGEAISLNYKHAETINTEQAYLQHINKYPKSSYINLARNTALELNFLQAKVTSTEDAYLRHIKDYPESKYIQNCLKAAEELGYIKLSQNSKIEDLNHFLELYPSTIYKDTIQALLNKRELEKIQDDFNQIWRSDWFVEHRRDVTRGRFSVNELAYLFLNNNIFARYFKSDTASLLDQLKKFNADLRISHYGCNYSDFKELDINNNISTKGLKSYGYTFYSKKNSKYCFETPNYTMSEDNYCECRGNVVLLNQENIQANENLFTIVSRTPFSYVFLCEREIEINDRTITKMALFNSKIGKFITEWADDIEPVALHHNFFKAGSNEAHLANSLFDYGDVYIGFKKVFMSGGSDSQRPIKKISIINSSGMEIIDSKKFPNPYLDRGENLGRIYCDFSALSSTLDNGTNILKYGDGGSTGLANSTFDTIILPAIYSKIGSVDYKNNLDVETFDGYIKIYNLETRKFMQIPQNVRRLERSWLPYRMNNWYYNYFLKEPNPNIKAVDNSEGYCKLPLKTPMIYTLDYGEYQNRFGTAIYNELGRVIYNGKAAKLHSASDSILIIKVVDNSHILASTQGKILWSPNKPYLMDFLTPEYILYGYITEDKGGDQQHIGLYHITRGVVFEPIFENIRVTIGACYGNKLGVETLMWSVDSNRP
jgi:outer membrane protein assembly factor BamD (BamD/ComL family)